MNFVNRARAALAQEVAAVVADGDDELRGIAHFRQQAIAAEVDHEFLRVGGEAEGHAEFLHEHGRVCGAVGEVDVDVLDAELFEELGKIEGVARADFRFERFAVIAQMALDHVAERLPGAVGFGLLLQRF